MEKQTTRNLHKAAILLSRQSLRSCGDTAWIEKSVEAVEWAVCQNLTVCGSMGMITWELITALSIMSDCRCLIYVPSIDKEDFSRSCTWLAKQFELNEERCEYHSVNGLCVDKAEINKLRDEQIICDADIILPVSIRPSGRLEKLLEGHAEKIDRRFQVDYDESSKRIAYRVDPSTLHNDLEELNQRYLIHWTRATNDAWPSENKIDFYRDLIESDAWPRSAFETLRRIMSDRIIHASDRHMPQKEKTVSFTALSIKEVIPLMRYRARYRQMSFEPYGIGIEREEAKRIGIKPVEYYNAEKNSKPPGIPAWLTQSEGMKGDWKAEDEYRCRGSINLDDISADKICLFCRFESEAQILREQFDYNVYAICRE